MSSLDPPSSADVAAAAAAAAAAAKEEVAEEVVAQTSSGAITAPIPTTSSGGGDAVFHQDATLREAITTAMVAGTGQLYEQYCIILNKTNSLDLTLLYTFETVFSPLSLFSYCSCMQFTTSLSFCEN